MDSLAEVIGQLGKYFMTVMLGLVLHGFGTIAVIFFLVVRRLPYGYVFKMSQVLATAFGTGSSSATMPITINCLDNMGIDPRVTRFVIPVGATINMDGMLVGIVHELNEFMRHFQELHFTRLLLHCSLLNYATYHLHSVTSSLSGNGVTLDLLSSAKFINSTVSLLLPLQLVLLAFHKPA